MKRIPMIEREVKRSKLYKTCKHELSRIPVSDPVDHRHVLRPDRWEDYDLLPCKLCGVFVPVKA